jgi:hypothetical protein
MLVVVTKPRPFLIVLKLLKLKLDNNLFMIIVIIQDVAEIGALILTGGGTPQKEQLFYLSFCQKTLFNSTKKLERFFTKIALRQWLIEISANMKKTSIFKQIYPHSKKSTS